MSRAKLLKIDTEGHELNVIKRLGDSIKVVNNLIVDMWDPLREEYQELVQLLR